MAGSQEKYLRPDVIQQVKRLDLRAKFIVEGFISGLQRSPFHGFSAEFSEHQKYEPGDDLARLDWNVYARTDRYYIKKYQAETNLTGYLVMDLSGSMDFPDPETCRAENRLSKFDYAICVAAALAYLMVNQSDAVGLITIDDRIRASLPPRSRRTQLGTILAALASQVPSERTNLAEALGQVASLVRRRSLVMVFSDLLPSEDGGGDMDAEIEAVTRALFQLRHGSNDVILFHVLDRSEVEFAFRGNTKFVGKETTLELPAAEAEAYRAAYLEELEVLRTKYRRACQTAGIDYLPLHTGMPFDKALMKYLLDRQNRF